MGNPTFVKNWDFSLLNQRILFVSLNDTMKNFLYGLKNYLVSTLGASVTYSCDGTTGPTSSSDHTDRWISASNASTRASVAAAAQSWIIISWAGVQLLLDYQGSSDDQCRISYSNGNNFALAGTSTNQPTATDEAVICTGITIVGTTTSSDRVYSVEGTTDRSVMRLVIYRQGTQLMGIGVEQVNSAISGHTFSPGVIGWNSTATMGQATGNGGLLGGTGNWLSSGGLGTMLGRVDSSNILVVGGGVMFGGGTSTTFFTDANCPLNGGASPVFAAMVCSNATALDGWIGTRYDCFYAYCNGYAIGDTLDDMSANTRLMCIGSSMMNPWDITKGLVTS